MTNLQALKVAVRQKKYGMAQVAENEQDTVQVNSSAKLPDLRTNTLVRRQRNVFWHGKHERRQEVAAKLAFREFLKEHGNQMSEKDLELQEIYNRYFFFRKEEISMQNKDEPRLNEDKVSRKRNYTHTVSQSMDDFHREEPVASRRSLH